MLFYSTTVRRFLTTVRPFFLDFRQYPIGRARKHFFVFGPMFRMRQKVLDILIRLEKYALDRVF